LLPIPVYAIYASYVAGKAFDGFREDMDGDAGQDVSCDTDAGMDGMESARMPLSQRE
jgi:hypothetical protein